MSRFSCFCVALFITLLSVFNCSFSRMYLWCSCGRSNSFPSQAFSQNFSQNLSLCRWKKRKSNVFFSSCLSVCCLWKTWETWKCRQQETLKAGKQQHERHNDRKQWRNELQTQLTSRRIYRSHWHSRHQEEEDVTPRVWRRCYVCGHRPEKREKIHHRLCNEYPDQGGEDNLSHWKDSDITVGLIVSRQMIFAKTRRRRKERTSLSSFVLFSSWSSSSCLQLPSFTASSTLSLKLSCSQRYERNNSTSYVRYEEGILKKGRCKRKRKMSEETREDKRGSQACNALFFSLCCLGNAILVCLSEEESNVQRALHLPFCINTRKASTQEDPRRQKM